MLNFNVQYLIGDEKVNLFEDNMLFLSRKDILWCYIDDELGI
jgi:hypothetical protein